MINTGKKYFQFLGLLLKHGRFGHSGENFNQSREESLKELLNFIPPSCAIALSGGTTSLAWKNAIARNLVAQLAFLKNSLKTKGDHLTSKDLSYIRIPKSASTSMSKEMLEKIYPALKQKAITENQINFLTDVNLQPALEDSVNLFTIVRNPFSRLVSVYRDFFEKKNNFIYRDYLFGVLHQHISFSEFVDRITCIPDQLKDQHIRPQHTFLKYYEKQNLDVKIFKLEHSEQLNQFLSQYDMKLPHLNKSAERYDFRSYYDAYTLNKVYTLYQVDIEKFDYRQEYKTVADYLSE